MNPQTQYFTPPEPQFGASSPYNQGYATAQNQFSPPQTGSYFPQSLQGTSQPPVPMSANAQLSGPGFQVSPFSPVQSPPVAGALGYAPSASANYGSAIPGYMSDPARPGTPVSKKRQWSLKAVETTKNLQSGQFHSSAVTWAFALNGTIPPNAINVAMEGSQPFFLCRSFYENELRTGRVSTGPQGTRAFVISKGKERDVNEYEVLVQSSGQPQWSFSPNQSSNNTSQTTVSLPVAQPAAPSAPAPILSGMDIVFIVDDSDSMIGPRWNDVRNALSGVAHACGEFDADGFDLYFLNDEYVQNNITNSDSIAQAFYKVSPDGATPTGARLRRVLDVYIDKLEDKRRPSKPVGIIVITDGDPTDDVESVIVSAAQRLERAQVPESQLAIHFIQIGDDLDAANALRHLDDNLSNKYRIRDMVDTTIPQYPQTQFRTETLYTVLQTMWRKQTHQGGNGDVFDQSIAQTFSPLSFNAQPLPNPDTSSLLSPLAIGTPGPNAQHSLNSFGQTNNNGVNYDRGQGQYPTHQNSQPLPFAITSGHGLSGPGQPSQGYTAPPPFTSRKDWIQKAQYLTASLKAPTIPSASVPYAWLFVDSDELPPSNAIVSGNENGRNTYFCRSFHENQMRFGTVVDGSTIALVLGKNNREIQVDQYEVLVQPSGFFFSFATGSAPLPPPFATVSAPLPPPLAPKMDIVLIVDDSDSMQGRLWNQARDALAAVAEASPKFDADGVDLFFLNSNRSEKNIKTRQDVIRLFNEVLPDGGTPTGARLQQVLNEYIPKVEHKLGAHIKPVNIIVITDGDPTDNVENVIVNAAHRLHQSQVPERMIGIQFVQIGDDEDATRALKELDTALEQKWNIRDMVDTTLYDPVIPQFKEDIIFKVLWGAIDRQVDRRDEYQRA